MTIPIGFIRDICKAPDENWTRLVAADWLDENGDPARAEFIRVQCELAKHPGMNCGAMYCSERDPGGLCDSCLRFKALRRRAEELRDSYPYPDRYVTNAMAWLLGDRGPDTHRQYHALSPSWSRGFPDSLVCTAADFLAHADEFCWGWGPCGQCEGKGQFPPLPEDDDQTPSPCPFCDHGRVPPTIACEKCKDVEHNYPDHMQAEVFRACVCRGSGRVPRECPATAQPIERVRLTTVPEEDGMGSWSFTRRPDGVWESPRWPGIAFELPPLPGISGDELLEEPVMDNARY